GTRRPMGALDGRIIATGNIDMNRNDRLLTPPPALEPAQSIQVWMELVDLGEQLVQSSFRAEFGPEGWLKPYQKWSENLNRKKDQRLESMLHRLAVAEAKHG